jgi:hypothetical protein
MASHKPFENRFKIQMIILFRLVIELPAHLITGTEQVQISNFSSFWLSGIRIPALLIMREKLDNIAFRS